MEHLELVNVILLTWNWPIESVRAYAGKPTPANEQLDQAARWAVRRSVPLLFVINAACVTGAD